MPHDSLQAAVRQLLQVVRPREAAGVADDELLRRFVTARDEAAFELLVWRHGGMVLRLCRRILHDAHEAEDAFQATFLVLARKAASIGRGQAVAGWLYKVAFRVALGGKSRAERRPLGEGALADPPAGPGADPCTRAAGHELLALLDREVRRLPEKHRLPIILCHLEGKSTEEAARELGCPVGTVLSRLARGRERLRGRLTRSGVVLPSAGLGALLAAEGLAAGVPPALLAATARAGVLALAGKAALARVVSARVASFADGALPAAAPMKALITGALLAAGVAITGSGVLVLAARPASPAVVAAPEQGRGRPTGKATGKPAETITADQFARLHGLIRPQPGESRWAEVPWLTDLREARRRAAAEDRPLFVWRAGGGEVLGRA